ncbi:multicopper oxidase-domain-containing protein [Gilbertella persicaria]|uniref:multicopper oxidase-domain-containing protein n=1 Tax=Gilbertella persicaria TaxID=101096 RepID=UPI00221FF30E|nr:multicopper oxidase-domain-containing protein [Gilbertella persicaria]KAI8079499.1 multicopper oxidase-domain-containing protein [Gilbertella persicaria]
MYLSILIVLLFCLSQISTKKVTYDWVLEYKHVNPDGLHERRVISINHQWPPVPVKLEINDTLVLQVWNKLNEPTVIHTHGILQNNGYNLYDGAAMVTQCPIPPHHDFVYEFPVLQAGTFWIHSHFKVQYMDGLRVPLIVYDPNEKIEYDEEEIITVSDWYHQDTYTNLEQYMNKENTEGVEPIPQSGLINDHVNSTFMFKSGKTYRLRLINMSGIAAFRVYLGGHRMQVIEVDGVLTKPTTTSSVYLSAGQRVSVLVETKDKTEFNYYLHADMDPEMLDDIPSDLRLNIKAPVYYNTSHHNFLDTPIETGGHEYDDAFIEPLRKTPALVPDRRINMTIDFMVNTDGLNHGVMNNIPYLPPLVPSLHTVLSIGDLANNTLVYGPQSQVSIFPLHQVVELVINNLDDGIHPFHLHGHVFQVIGRGQGIFDQHSLEEPSNPTCRDTITVPSKGYVVLRFKADNPGVWFFHCHVDWHLPAGLAATFITAPEWIQQHMKMTPALRDLCLASGTPPTGNAAGKKGLDLEGVPDGIRPSAKQDMMLGGLLATLLGTSTIIWHVWVDNRENS